MTQNSIPRPFLKWVGGKSQLVSDLMHHIPSSFNDYWEPFLGGGALFFALYRENRIKHAFLSDLNAELIDTYIAIRDCVEEVIKILTTYSYNSDIFYQIRELNPSELSIEEKAARMIYLNKTCYNGLYRVNKEGKFNVPFGSYRSPRIVDEENLKAVSKALQKVDIFCSSFEKCKSAKSNDFIYFDPPYVPISKTSHFTSYQANGFTHEDHYKLRNLISNLTEKNIKVLLSNSDTELVHELFKISKFYIKKVKAIRAINCNGEKRGKVSELIVTNYPLCQPINDFELHLEYERSTT